MKQTFAEKILQFNRTVQLDNSSLPDGIRVMNPFQDEGSDVVWNATAQFYHKYYNDQFQRKLILGINPGRFGAGVTGIPFTDTKRLEEVCGITLEGVRTHEPSSVFVYDTIAAYGGAKAFYQDFFVTSLSPLGFVTTNSKGREVNYNFYDQKNLEDAVTPFIIDSLRKQIAFGISCEKVFLLGSGKNYQFFKKLNAKENFFEEIIPLEHPRFIMQYRNKQKEDYINKYLSAFSA